MAACAIISKARFARVGDNDASMAKSAVAAPDSWSKPAHWPNAFALRRFGRGAREAMVELVKRSVEDVCAPRPCGLPQHPLFAALAPFEQRFSASVEDLNDLLSVSPGAGGLRFAAQTPDLIVDGLHYEERIGRLGLIASREDNTHDAFNALMWLGHPALKRAMNSRQVKDIARVGPKQRTRGQYALTHFDEAGAIVWLSGSELVSAWDAHDWRALYRIHRDAWGVRIAVTVIGHALFDYALEHDELPVAKALAVRVDSDDIARLCRGALIASWPDAEQTIAEAIATERLLTDPQELRPLPLAGIPGWHGNEQSDVFYRAAPCFRPLRPGRRYPPAVALGPSDNRDAGANAVAQAAIR